MKQPFTPSELSTILRMSVKTVYKLLNSGEIPARKLGGNWFIDQGNFEEFIKTPKTPKEARRPVGRHNL
jgi:excisionase family DNA binding protein